MDLWRVYSVSFFLTLILFPGIGAQAQGLRSAFAAADFEGQLRVYNNTLALQHAKDRYGTAFGGRLAMETNKDALNGFSFGAAFYSANDLQTNKDEAMARAPFTPTQDIDILGESYIRWTGAETTITAGRLLVVTPFANPSDAFLLPVTYTGYSLVNKSLQNLTFNLHHLVSIKTRESAQFTDVGEFAAARLGGISRDTNGVSIAGLTYELNSVKVQLWHYGFADMFDMHFLEVDYRRDMGTHKPYVSGHAANQNEAGRALLGHSDANLLGAKAGTVWQGFDMWFAYELIQADRFLSPFTYFTDALYTNSMITGFSNIEEGSAFKLALSYDISQGWWAKLTHSRFRFDSGADTSESDFDVRYKFAKESDWDGFSALVRVGYRDGSRTPAALPDLLEYRTQLQYVF